jgi:hypothetical protein
MERLARNKRTIAKRLDELVFILNWFDDKDAKKATKEDMQALKYGELNEREGSKRYGKSIWPSESAVTNMFRRNFKMNLINPRTRHTVSNTGLNQHIERHMSLLLQHNYPMQYVIKTFGWINSRMLLENYASIRDRLSIYEQEAMLKEKGLFVNRNTILGLDTKQKGDTLSTNQAL